MTLFSSDLHLFHKLNDMVIVELKSQFYHSYDRAFYIINDKRIAYRLYP